MSDKEIFSEQLNQLPAENADSFALFDHWHQQFPASPVVNFYYLKLLQVHDLSLFEQIKSKYMLTLINRDIYYHFTLVPLIEEIVNVQKMSNSVLKGIEVLPEKESEKKEDIIDSLITKFSKDPPKIIPDPSLHDVSANYGKRCDSKDEEIVTETLAGIYADQGFYSKSIKMYEKLRLTNPKKSGYFAERILQVKNLQKEEKKKSKTT